MKAAAADPAITSRAVCRPVRWSIPAARPSSARRSTRSAPRSPPPVNCSASSPRRIRTAFFMRRHIMRIANILIGSAIALSVAGAVRASLGGAELADALGAHHPAARPRLGRRHRRAADRRKARGEMGPGRSWSKTAPAATASSRSRHFSAPATTTCCSSARRPRSPRIPICTTSCLTIRAISRRSRASPPR